MSSLFHLHRWKYYLPLQEGQGMIRTCASCPEVQAQIQTLNGLLWKKVEMEELTGEIWIVSSLLSTFRESRDYLTSIYQDVEFNPHSLLNEDDWQKFESRVREHKRVRLIFANDWYLNPYLDRPDFKLALAQNVNTPAILFRDKKDASNK